MWVILSVFLETFVFCITKLNDVPGHFTQNWLIIDEFSIKKLQSTVSLFILIQTLMSLIFCSVCLFKSGKKMTSTTEAHPDPLPEGLALHRVLRPQMMMRKSKFKFQVCHIVPLLMRFIILGF